MKRFVIENLCCIKELRGVNMDGRFRYLETFDADHTQGQYRKYYAAGDHFDTLQAARSEVNRRRLWEIEKLQAQIDKLSIDETVTVLDKDESLHYANSYLKNEPNFTYQVDE